MSKGFVQTDKSITLGQSFNQTSTIDGLVVELPLAILQVIFKLGTIFTIKRLELNISFNLLTRNNISQ
jgi:hypothetical protein